MAFVDFDRVSLAYDDSGNAIEDITLKIEEGEFVAFVGPSGCGKSTFMKLCTGLHGPTGGQVRVDDEPVGGPLKISGMAFQNANLLPWRTTLDNVLLPLEIVKPYRHEFRRRREEFVGWARDLLRTVGLEGYEDQYPWQLSGGMQQRASICRALIHRPRLLMLDEPFAALDAFTREELWCVLRDLWEAQRFTVVLVTHDLREAAFLADTVYVMSRRPGRIIERRQIDLPRPRELATTYEAPFIELVQALRAQIGEIRSA
ncbi:ABC transporter ATP-binding protein [Halomonas urumqiensis]|uniref:Nitrate ABC transporter ATP-binding protein n=1 Tax=Halomonas urumqiensis TaxID=1684789 RepID=A0A2N7UEZ8_9GAMM|nr:ABC transporter ATP-binding protein [Halomonas urumqiensis]PMR78990.1 nitrate ABC transporter ATP-binding protein [Halomonas urumqiensis]PTB00984.1 ABC transporter ATP-binding protein [Halomonas urumqiensis]GHE22928.1 nitrate ABC transporter ATP-binding protein [Halomonas urumqiensis]